MMGAAAFKGVARSVYVFSCDPEALGDGNQYCHIMSPARGQLGESFKYHTESVDCEYDGEKSKAIRVVWDGRSKATAEDGVTPVSQKDKGAIKEAAAILRNYLKAGKRPASECVSFLKTEGYDLEKLNSHRVRKATGVESEQKDRQSWWFLPTARNLFEPPAALVDKEAPKY